MKRAELNDRLRNSADKSIRQKPIASSAILTYGDGNMFLETNGEVAGLQIIYKGSFRAVKLLGRGWTMSSGRNTVLIYSLCKAEFSEHILRYVGELEVLSCKVATWNKNLFNAYIKTKDKKTFNSTSSAWGSKGDKWENMKYEKIVKREVLKTRM